MPNDPVAMPFHKYRPYDTVSLPDRTWPDVVLDRAPIWCSTDLRDGNQALVNPMDAGRKRRFFDLLVALGFKEIEVGFPSASKTDFDFVRTLVEQDLIPDDVTIAVLTQARPELIERTYESIEGARRAIVHLYNSTSVTQRRVVFRLDRDGHHRPRGPRHDALQAARGRDGDRDRVPVLAGELPPHRARLRARDLRARRRGVGADAGREDDRQPADDGRAVPAERLRRPDGVVRAALLVPRFRDPLRPPAQRPRHRRRHGRARADGRRRARRGDALRQRRAHGQRRPDHDRAEPADPGRRPEARPLADRRDARDRRGVQRAAGASAPSRRSGELVYTAFSGSHQDAIKKGMDAQERSGSEVWDVPYLSIDPKDVGRSYEAIIRVNSQSGKGGVAYLLATEHNLELPRGLQVDFARRVQPITDARGGELTSDELLAAFTESLPRPRASVRAPRLHALERGGHGPDRRPRPRRRRGAGDRGRGQRAARGARPRLRARHSASRSAPRLPRAHDGRARRRAGGGLRRGRTSTTRPSGASASTARS